MLEVLIGLALLALGFWGGWKANGRLARRLPAPPTPEEQELRRMQEDKAAFELLMGYNAQRAYGGMEE